VAAVFDVTFVIIVYSLKFLKSSVCVDSKFSSGSN